jgi:hypothetical protein
MIEVYILKAKLLGEVGSCLLNLRLVSSQGVVLPQAGALTCSIKTSILTRRCLTRSRRSQNRFRVVTVKELAVKLILRMSVVDLIIHY